MNKQPIGNSFKEQQAWAEHQETLGEARSAKQRAKRDLDGGDFYIWSWKRDNPEEFSAYKAWWASPNSDAELEAKLILLATTDRSGEMEQFLNLGNLMTTAKLITLNQFKAKLIKIGIPDLNAYKERRHAK